MPKKKDDAYYKKQKKKEQKKYKKERVAVNAIHAAACSPAQRKLNEKNAINKILRDVNRNIAPIPGDGNCLFASLLHQIRQVGLQNKRNSTDEYEDNDGIIEVVNSIRDGASPMYLRRFISDYMLSHEADYLPFLLASDVSGDTGAVATGENFSEYCEKIATDTTMWGTMLEVKAASEAFNQRIAVITTHGVRIFGEDEGSMPLVYDDENEGHNIKDNDWCIIFFEHSYALGAHFDATTQGYVEPSQKRQAKRAQCSDVAVVQSKSSLINKKVNNKKSHTSESDSYDESCDEGDGNNIDAGEEGHCDSSHSHDGDNLSDVGAKEDHGVQNK